MYVFNVIDNFWKDKQETGNSDPFCKELLSCEGREGNKI